MKKLFFLFALLFSGTIYGQVSETIDLTDLPSVVYRQNPDLRIYFMIPDSLGKHELRPAIVFFHGGSWIGGSPAQFLHQGLELVKRGMVVALVDYRVESRHGTNPTACVEDAKSAMRFIKANATEYHIDSHMLAAGGGSAGGHLAAATALVEGFDAPGEYLEISPVPDVLVLFNPVVNNAPIPEGYGYERIQKWFPDISPAHQIRRGAPATLLMVGDQDQLIPVGTLEKYKSDMKKVGSLCELEVYPGAGHSFFNYRKGEENGGEFYTATLQRMIQFLKKLGYIR